MYWSKNVNVYFNYNNIIESSILNCNFATQKISHLNFLIIYKKKCYVHLYKHVSVCILSDLNWNKSQTKVQKMKKKQK